MNVNEIVSNEFVAFLQSLHQCLDHLHSSHYNPFTKICMIKSIAKLCQQFNTTVYTENNKKKFEYIFAVIFEPLGLNNVFKWQIPEFLKHVWG